MGMVTRVTGDEECPFCPPVVSPRIVVSDQLCFVIWTGETPLGSCMVVPHAHRPTVFDLTDDEWRSTRSLLDHMRELIATEHAPDGFNVGWNVDPAGGQSVMHAHCHLIPRYHDEPYAGRGLRAWLKDPANRPARHHQS
jgi:histidine triad (HIT) family protein